MGPVHHLLAVVLVAWSEATFYTSNRTDLSKCKVHYSRNGSAYEAFYDIADEPRGNGTLLDFHFAVLASSDAHILLAPSRSVEKGDPVYEIVIGAGGNTFCDIRRMIKSSVKASVRIKGLLSALDVQAFWIHISADGAIGVGREGEREAFISWTDPDPLPLRVFSFSTWSGVEAKWFFDCPRAAGGPKEARRHSTSLELLRRDLLYWYDPYVRPVKNITDFTTVGFAIALEFVDLDEHSANFVLDATVDMNWTDEKLRWNASNYGGVGEMHIFRREIWVPNLYCFNAAGESGDVLDDSMLVVNASGSVRWQASFRSRTWCSPQGLGRWPRDVHVCAVSLAFWRDYRYLKLNFSSRNSRFDAPFSAKWAILAVDSDANTGWQNGSGSVSDAFDPPSLSLLFRLQRTSTSYSLMLFSPFALIATPMLLAFWASPFGFMKISLVCVPAVLSSLMLLTLGLLIPIHSRFVPNLVLLYAYALLASATQVFIAVVVINLSRNQQKYSVPHCLAKILTSKCLKRFLCLPDFQRCEEYGSLNGAAGPGSDSQSLWILLGTAIDRVAFIVYAALITYASCLTY